MDVALYEPIYVPYWPNKWVEHVHYSKSKVINYETGNLYHAAKLMRVRDLAMFVNVAFAIDKCAKTWNKNTELRVLHFTLLHSHVAYVCSLHVFWGVWYVGMLYECSQNNSVRTSPSGKRTVPQEDVCTLVCIYGERLNTDTCKLCLHVGRV